MRTTINGPQSVLDLKRPPTAPGEMLRAEFLDPAGLTQVEAARRMRMPLNRLNEIVKGKRGITADTALRLARLFKMSPEFWLHLQADYDALPAVAQVKVSHPDVILHAASTSRYGSVRAAARPALVDGQCSVALH